MPPASLYSIFEDDGLSKIENGKHHESETLIRIIVDNTYP
jgi:hypothetical protein